MSEAPQFDAAIAAVQAVREMGREKGGPVSGHPLTIDGEVLGGIGANGADGDSALAEATVQRVASRF